MDIRIRGIAVVTGGASGIGAACARVLAAAGATVAIVDRDMARASSVATELGGRAFDGDVADEQQMQWLAQPHRGGDGPGQRAGQQRRRHPGAPAAGATEHAGLGRRRPRRSARHLCRQRRVCQGDDRATQRRHRQHRLDRRHALDAAACLCAGQGSGHLDDRMPRRRMGSGRHARQCRLARLHPDTGLAGHDRCGRARCLANDCRCGLGRLVEPLDIAQAVVFLASPDATAITGINLPVDAGWLVATPWNTYGGLRGPEGS